MAQERIQKILAKAGIASRRKAEELIQLGEVTVNGKIAKLGDKADLEHDAIKVQGRLLQTAEPHVYVAFYKPRAVISMFADPEGRPTLADFLNKVHVRLFPVGRLDFNSEGLLLLTNDGDIAEKLNRRDEIARTYEIKVKGHPDQGMLSRLERGARIGNRLIKPHSVSLPESYTAKSRIRLVLVGSGAVDVKTFLELKGFLVERITRTAIGHITVHGMQPGEYRFLTKSQILSLLEQPELGMRLAEEDKKQEEGRRVREIEKQEREAERAARASETEEGAERPSFRVSPVGARPERSERGARPPRGGAPRTYSKPFGKKSFGGERRSEGREEGRSEGRGGFGKKRSFGSGKPGFGKREGFEKRGSFEKRPRANSWGDEERGSGGFGGKSRGGGAKRGGFEKRGAKPFGRGGDKPSFGAGRSGGGKPSFGGSRTGGRPARGKGFGGASKGGPKGPRGPGRPRSR